MTAVEEGTQSRMYDVGRSLATDYFGIRDQIDRADVALLEKARAFVDDEVLPVIGGFWERAEFPYDLVRRLGELGLVGGVVDGYGCPSMSEVGAGLVNMEINRGDGSLGTFIGVQAGLVMKSIAAFGSEEQKQRWLGPLARVEEFGAFALTEPLHGSDSVALETTARREGDEWVLDGEKRWIGNGTIAHVLVVWARSSEDGQVKGFLVPGDAPGLTRSRIEGKVSVRAVWQADLRFDGVRIPADAQLPGARNFKDTGAVLASTRGSVAWSALGHATAAYECALAYSRQREQFGHPLASFQLVQDKLVRMLAEVTAMQLYCMQIVKLQQAGKLTDTIASLAKLNNTRKAREVILEARELLGGNGILLDYHVVRHMADIEAIYTYEGTADIQELIVGRKITGESAFT
ncbi:MAG TPA: acyl-CoA dehydrogenase family protein [Mycobacteriales bacterium]|jgi:glutaryl-CoA dehydrogenase|nr:acyl-CoA dehydrogenase family protein [Mycobacteriales bacterium]